MSRQAEVDSRGADILNLDQDVQISSHDLLSTSAKFVESDEVKVVKKESTRIAQNHEMGEFPIPICQRTCIVLLSGTNSVKKV